MAIGLVVAAGAAVAVGLVDPACGDGAGVGCALVAALVLPPHHVSNWEDQRGGVVGCFGRDEGAAGLVARAMVTLGLDTLRGPVAAATVTGLPGDPTWETGTYQRK